MAKTPRAWPDDTRQLERIWGPDPGPEIVPEPPRLLMAEPEPDPAREAFLRASARAEAVRRANLHAPEPVRPELPPVKLADRKPPEFIRGELCFGHANGLSALAKKTKRPHVKRRFGEPAEADHLLASRARAVHTEADRDLLRLMGMRATKRASSWPEK